MVEHCRKCCYSSTTSIFVSVTSFLLFIWLGKCVCKIFLRRLFGKSLFLKGALWELWILFLELQIDPLRDIWHGSCTFISFSLHNTLPYVKKFFGHQVMCIII